jgi:isopentenyldiphosphate isomerase
MIHSITMHPDDEKLPLVNPRGEVVGEAFRRQCHQGPGLLHPVVHLHVINHAGEIYLQKRSARKDVFPRRWDTAVGGHIACGESIEQALKREAQEEIGLSEFIPKALGTHTIDTPHESEFVYVFVTRHDTPLRPNPDELEDGRFWTRDAIEASLGTGVFTPNFEKDYELLKRAGTLQPAHL